MKISAIVLTLFLIVTNLQSKSHGQFILFTKFNCQYKSIEKSDLSYKINKGCCRQKSNFNFRQLYPFLKKSLLDNVCEAYRIDESENTLTVYSLDSDMFLSSWEWDLVNQPMLIKDIDNDGRLDYTIELINQGGGCGGQVGQSERWTFFGGKSDKFIWTHIIPYRSKSGKWQRR